VEARKRVERSLLRSRERLRMVLDSITDGYYLLDSKWRFVEVNPVAERHFGRSAGELKGKVVWDVAPTPRESIVFKEFHLALLENHPVDFEAESGIHPDRWFELHLYPRDGMLEVYYRDITERKLAEKSLAAARDLLQHQVYLLQRALIPDKPEAIEGYSTASAYIPAYAGTEIGGDFLDVFRTEDGKVGILIGDVSGKGIESASLAASTRSTIRAFAYDSSSPSHALFHANSLLATQHIENMQFVTAFLAVLDPATGCVRYSSAGHPPAIICREGGTDILYVSSMPLGILDRVQYDEGLYTLSPGDSMVLYTDGITEARHDHVLFGTEGIENILSAYGSAPPDELVEEILSAVKDWAHGNLRDDTAILIVRREE
jgi:PAS domain S-box-containing protein